MMLDANGNFVAPVTASDLHTIILFSLGAFCVVAIAVKQFLEP